MEAIVITFERRTGALERLLIAPISLWSVLMAKVLGGAIFGLMISGVMTVISVVTLGMTVTAPLWFLTSLTLTLLTLSALGALVAVSVKEVFEAQTISNYFRFPMIFLCGVFIPVGAMPAPLQVVAYLLPLTYSVESLRATTGGVSGSLGLVVPVVVLSLFLAGFLATAHALLKRSLK
jgi:ABC-2 type transport system permease protein